MNWSGMVSLVLPKIHKIKFLTFEIINYHLAFFRSEEVLVPFCIVIFISCRYNRLRIHVGFSLYHLTASVY